MTGIHIGVNVNRRGHGEPRKFHPGAIPTFRLTCTSCGHEATVSGRRAAEKWVTEHRHKHLNPVFVRQEVVKL